MNDKVMPQFDFYYGKESEQFSFYRIPKLLFTEERFKNVSMDAKVLYGLLLDRMSLSIKNGWVDDENRVYIYFTLEETMDFLSIGKDKGVKIFAELDDEKGCGLIKKRRQGLGKPTMIYVMNFNSVIVYDYDEEQGNSGNFQASEKPNSELSNITEVRTSEKPKFRNLKKRSIDIGKTEVKETNINNTYNNKKNNNNNLILSNQNSGNYVRSIVKDAIEEREIYQKIIAENIEYFLVCENYDQDKAQSILDIMLDAICSKKTYLMISGGEIPQVVVKSRLLKLDYRHIEYVLDCLKNNTTKIHNVQNYILTALYNSFNTIDYYYTALVNRDLYANN